jgi:hypothetical protein
MINKAAFHYAVTSTLGLPETDIEGVRFLIVINSVMPLAESQEIRDDGYIKFLFTYTT